MKGERGGVATPFICSPPVKLGHRVTRARKRPSLGWVDPFPGPLHQRVRVHSEDRGRGHPSVPSFLPSFLAALFRWYLARSFAHSPKYRTVGSIIRAFLVADPARSSRGSGTADRLTRRLVARLHMTVPQASVRRSIRLDDFTTHYPSRAGGTYHPLLVALRRHPQRSQRRLTPLSSTPSVTTDVPLRGWVYEKRDTRYRRSYRSYNSN